ncbi:MAG: flagellar biosynthetic protein FliO [Alphaproteobacteria bacterium]|nr:flagellar biosynthetic protein FliO [Alphaproteobacteria bacterium]
MGPLLSLFGGDNAVVTVLVALVVVLVLIILGVWALKLVFNATGRASRGRAKRLGVVDVAPVDQKRQLVLIRRDNVEHLLLIGGAQDLVVETSIFTGPPLGRPMRPPQPGQPGAAAHQTQPVAPPPAPSAQTLPPVQPAQPAVASGPARVRGTNLPPDLMAARGAGMTTRSSMRHSPLLRQTERREPDFIPSPALRPSSPPADSDKQSDTDPVPNDAGAGSEHADFREEPHFDRDGNDTREAQKDN